jgi:hypothetical protein
MQNLLPPNVRIVSDSYAEKHPSSSSKFSNKEFGPVSESMCLHLPLPLSMVGKSPAEIMEWLMSDAVDASAVKVSWGTIYEGERARMHARLVRQVVRAVNAAIDRNEILADKRDAANMRFW